MEEKAPFAHLKGFINSVSECQKRGEFTDFTLVCKGERFQVHKVIVCSQSAVLLAACMGPFKEASSGVYEMNDDPLPMVKNLVDYLYTLDYNENLRTLNQECPSPISGLQVHARMFALADKYDIKALQVLSSEKYSNMLESSSIGSEFLGSIPDVYTLTPPSVKALRDKVARFARINLENYLQDPSSREVYKRIAIDVPDFLQDLLDLYIMNPLTGFCYRCNPLSTMQALQTPCHKCGLSGICYDSE